MSHSSKTQAQNHWQFRDLGTLGILEFIDFKIVNYFLIELMRLRVFKFYFTQ
jgi:hypothetical protein